MKKKIAALLLSAAMAVSLLAGCGSSHEEGQETQEQSENKQEESSQEENAQNENQEETENQTENQPVDVNVMALKGPTAMGMVKLMDDVDNGQVTSENYSFSIAASADEVTPKLVQGEADIAAVPANLASVLYNKTEGQVQVLAVNTLGVLYIVENGETVQSVEDLRGKTIYASGKGSTPEYALEYVLSANGIDPAADVTIEWKSEHSECVAAITAGENGIAMLPQPFVTTAQAKNPSIRTALDLTQEWDNVQQDQEVKSSLITGVVVARSQFVEEEPEAVEDFLDKYQDSVDYVNANLEEAAQLVGHYDIVTAEVAQKAIPACNIVFLEGAEMKEKLSGYLEVLKSQNPEAVGGEVPGDDFYYSR
ncbi:MAG TPA: ABC transporter substrate-binding protein [Candidatus Blautia pullicola]|jgi:NitT/TauT family transport system substrate-binding protein|uniref:ABC transporter substrate-binding protein n=1 Tax=Candidatus Blautia pullicola TaxID=2838498 RepID=A0A9D2FSJ3_9FIRM|nr:ABC transporter substrate-binding protein [Candidatus Blautia pullicola]